MKVLTKTLELDRLEKLGFKKLSGDLQKAEESKRKMAVAYEHYRFVKPEKIVTFNERLRKETLKEHPNAYYYKKLVFIPLGEYDRLPESHVLDSLEEAQGRKCFDSFEVGKIDDVKEVKDPILFGRVAGCEDRFYIDQWDDDVKIEDILLPHEG